MTKPDMQVQTVYINRVNISINHFGMRISFGESPDGGSHNEQFRTAVFLPMPTAEEFRRLVGQAMDQYADTLEQGQSH